MEDSKSTDQLPVNSDQDQLPVHPDQDQLLVQSDQDQLLVLSDQDQLLVQSDQDQLPVQSDQDQLPVHSDQDQFPVHSEQDQLPVHSEQDQLPVHSDQDQLPVFSDQDQLPVHPDQDQLPALSDQDQLPVHPDQDQLPVQSDQDQLPVHSDQDQPSVHPDQNQLPVHPDQDQLPVNPDQDQLPVHSDQDQLPVNPDQDQIPVHPDQDQLPVHSDQDQPPVHPDQNQLPVRPDQDQLPVRPDQDQLPVRPDQDQLPVRPDQDQLPVNPDQDQLPVNLDQDQIPVHSDQDQLQPPDWQSQGSGRSQQDQRPAEKPDQHIDHKDLPTTKQKPEPSLEPDLLPTVQNQREKPKTNDIPPEKDQPEPDSDPDSLKPDPLCPDQKKPEDHEPKLESLDLQTQIQEGLYPPHLDTQQASQSPPLVLAPPLTCEVFSGQVPRPLVSSSGEPKLCGFLQKQGGPLRAWKQRWFTYEEKKNQLFYYRTPQDVRPLGRVELCCATFTYPLNAERGTFHIKTPERTFVLKAVSQEVMLYWLQQLQVKRWQHRQMSDCPDLTNNNVTADDFLPALKSPLGLVGEEAANMASQRAPLANVSLKHPLIEIQNSVHCLRKRSSQDWSPSVFHVEAPPWTPPNSADTTVPPAPRTPSEPPAPPPLLSLVEPAGQGSPAEGRNRKMKERSSSPMAVLRRDTLSSDRTSRLQQEKQMLVEEVKAQKELVSILHKALEAAQLEKRTCAEFLAEKGEQERLELLRHRERQAVDLRGRLEEVQREVEAMRRSLTQRDAQLADLQENIRLLTEKNNAKQEVIIKLSDQVTSCLSSAGGLESRTFEQLQKENENLKDDIEAYRTQNQFLNSELYQLTGLWRSSSEQEKSLMMKCAYLEASHCQVESRYLGVLRQLQETKTLDPVQQGVVQKLIEDALKGELKSVLKLNVARDHDDYGFKIIPDYEVEDMKLLAKIQALEIRSHNLLHQEAGDRPLLSRWAQFLAGRSDGDLIPSPELKGLLRGGVPQEYRQRVWHWMIRTRTRTIRERHPQRYQELCEKSRTCLHPASRQIQLDLHRTLITNQHFSSPSSPALQQLRRILLAFTWQNPDIGYCQGLNRLAAITLLVLQNEEDAFWGLVAVVETIMPQDYYTKNLVASQADQRVLKDFLVEKLPRLAAHFEDHSIDVSLITFNWFLVVFVESLPSDILLPLWDAFLYEGTKVIFRYALALFKYKEEDILKIQDSVEIYQYLRFFTKTISDGRKLTSIAFSVMNPFPGRLLRNRRAMHLDCLQGELRELEQQQREFVTESAEHKDKELDMVVSEDDEP